MSPPGIFGVSSGSPVVPEHHDSGTGPFLSWISAIVCLVNGSECDMKIINETWHWQGWS